MSILLEALRKSEKNQNPSAVPDIHSDTDADRHTDSIQTGPLAVLLVLALFSSGWFVWNQYQAPAGLNQAADSRSADGVKSADAPAVEPAVIPVQNARTQPTTAVVSNSDGRPRTPVESYQEPAKSKPANENVNSSHAVTATEKPQTNQLASSTKTPPTTAKGVGESRPHEPAPISYWELPDSIRADVPEIKFSVLVYAKRAKDRFVLINGQRLGEGDSVQAGLVIKEIRREGVVFSYRLYQFLVER